MDGYFSTTALFPEKPMLEMILLRAGSYIWGDEEIADYMRHALEKTRQPHLYESRWWHNAFLLELAARRRSTLDWQVAAVTPDYHYSRDGKMMPLLQGIRDIALKLSVLLPDSKFQVSYIGSDPILWWRGSDPRTGLARKVPVAVWEETRRGIRIVPPPSAIPEWMRDL